jgi:hypothetical protein
MGRNRIPGEETDHRKLAQRPRLGDVTLLDVSVPVNDH